MNDVTGRMRPLLAALGIVAGLAAFGAPSSAPAAEPNRVLMVDNEPDLTNWHYDPAEITVPAGTPVVWFNQGKEEHTVTSDPGSKEKFDSGYKKRGASWQRAFSRPGRYTYHCTPHPWMKGAVVVVAAEALPSTSAAAAAHDPASTTTAPPASTTSSTFPPSLAAPGTAPAETGTTAAAETTSTSSAGKDSASGEPSVAPAASRKRSGGRLAGTLAVVLLPTLGGLALGARLRRSKPD
jgi:plastocyanin